MVSTTSVSPFFVMADRFAEPGRHHVFRMLVGEVDAAHHVVALPDHPHLFGGLDEVERLEWPQKLAGNASRIASRLRRKGNVAHALQYLVVGRLNLRCRPRLEHRVFRIGDTLGRTRTGPIPLGVIPERIGRVILDRTVLYSGRWILPILKVRLPAEIGRGELRDGVRRLGPRRTHGKRHHCQADRETAGRQSDATARR
jgi:hypothetical protein